MNRRNFLTMAGFSCAVPLAGTIGAASVDSDPDLDMVQFCNRHESFAYQTAYPIPGEDKDTWTIPQACRTWKHNPNDEILWVMVTAMQDRRILVHHSRSEDEFNIWMYSTMSATLRRNARRLARPIRTRDCIVSHDCHVVGFAQYPAVHIHRLSRRQTAYVRSRPNLDGMFARKIKKQGRPFVIALAEPRKYCFMPYSMDRFGVGVVGEGLMFGVC